MSHFIHADWEFDPPKGEDDYIVGKVHAEFNFVRGYPESGPSWDSGGEPGEPDEVDVFNGSITINGHERPLTTEELAILNTSDRFRELCTEIALDRS